MAKPYIPPRIADILKATESSQAVRQTGALADAMKAVEALRLPQLEAAGNLSRQLEANRAPLVAINKMIERSEPFQTIERVKADIDRLAPSVTLTTGAPPQALSSPSARRRVSSPADLGQFVRERRAGMSLTQQDLADAAGTGRRFISELEGGKATLEFGRIIQVCRILGIDLFAMTR